jgi:hypothetical protein
MPATPSAQALGTPTAPQSMLFSTFASVSLSNVSVQPTPPDPTSGHLQRCMDSVQELAKTIACAMGKWQGHGLLDCLDVHGSYAKVSANIEQLPADVECMRCMRRAYKSTLHSSPSRVSLSSICTCNLDPEPGKRRRTSGTPHDAQAARRLSSIPQLSQQHRANYPFGAGPYAGWYPMGHADPNLSAASKLLQDVPARRAGLGQWRNQSASSEVVLRSSGTNPQPASSANGPSSQDTMACPKEGPAHDPNATSEHTDDTPRKDDETPIPAVSTLPLPEQTTYDRQQQRQQQQQRVTPPVIVNRPQPLSQNSSERADCGQSTELRFPDHPELTVGQDEMRCDPGFPWTTSDVEALSADSSCHQSPAGTPPGPSSPLRRPRPRMSSNIDSARHPITSPVLTASELTSPVIRAQRHHRHHRPSSVVLFGRPSIQQQQKQPVDIGHPQTQIQASGGDADLQHHDKAQAYQANGRGNTQPPTLTAESVAHESKASQRGRRTASLMSGPTMRCTMSPSRNGRGSSSGSDQRYYILNLSDSEQTPDTRLEGRMRSRSRRRSDTSSRSNERRKTTHAKGDSWWSSDRVQSWMAMHKFSDAWQAAFEHLGIQGSRFLDIGRPSGVQRDVSFMVRMILPQVMREYERCGSVTDSTSTSSRDEGRRLRGLVRDLLAYIAVGDWDLPDCPGSTTFHNSRLARLPRARNGDSPAVEVPYGSSSLQKDRNGYPSDPRYGADEDASEYWDARTPPGFVRQGNYYVPISYAEQPRTKYASSHPYSQPAQPGRMYTRMDTHERRDPHYVPIPPNGKSTRKEENEQHDQPDRQKSSRNPQPYDPLDYQDFMSIPPPPPLIDNQPSTSATYVPGGESFGPGIGIPPLPIPNDNSQTSSPEPQANSIPANSVKRKGNSDSFSGPDADCTPSPEGSPSLQPPITSATLVPYDDKSIPSRSSSPARGLKSRSSSNASDQRDYILDLADPKRTASDGAKGPRQQKHRATFECTLCPKRFTRAYNLRSHLRTHTDERPFVCTVCGKAFARQPDCKRHEGLHSGSRQPRLASSQSASTGHLPENTTSDVGEDENIARDDEAPPKPSGVMAPEEPHSSDEDEPFIFQQDNILQTPSPGSDLNSMPPPGIDSSDYPVPTASDWDGPDAMMTVGPANADEQQLGRERTRSHLEAFFGLNLGASDTASTDPTPEKTASGSGVANQDGLVNEDGAVNEDDTGNGDDMKCDVSAVQALLNRWLNSSTSALLLKDDEIVT